MYSLYFRWKERVDLQIASAMRWIQLGSNYSNVDIDVLNKTSRDSRNAATETGLLKCRNQGVKRSALRIPMYRDRNIATLLQILYSHVNVTLGEIERYVRFEGMTEQPCHLRRLDGIWTPHSLCWILVQDQRPEQRIHLSEPLGRMSVVWLCRQLETIPKGYSMSSSMGMSRIRCRRYHHCQ